MSESWHADHVYPEDHVDTGCAHRLVLLRHAKSGYPDGVADHDRPLAKRGRRDAPAVGRWLAEGGYVPDAVVCSTALRARETWEFVSESLAKSGGLPKSGGPAESEDLAGSGSLAGSDNPDPVTAPTGTGPTGTGPTGLEVRFEPRVYEATVLGLLMLVRELPEDQRTVLLVGHNPGLAELAVGLTDPPPPAPSGFPTAAVAVLGLPGPWADAGPASARLIAFAAPADMSAGTLRNRRRSRQPPPDYGTPPHYGIPPDHANPITRTPSREPRQITGSQITGPR